MAKRKRRAKTEKTGKLEIGDSWNAITIIALSQNNPLKAIAEFVENSIDAQAKNVVIVRGREAGQNYLRITDDGTGVPSDKDGLPDFNYVATHICDSIKREMKARGANGIQGEFGIGLLSFWTVGESLTMTSTGTSGQSLQMRMKKGEPGYMVEKKRTLFDMQGTELLIKPLLPGIRKINGEKIQWYLASELRDRIRKSGVNIIVKDRHARKEFKVEPRRFSGRLLHEMPSLQTPHGDIYLELYLGAGNSDESGVGLYRSGTRVLESFSLTPELDHEPWVSEYLQGIVDVPFLKLTPGTRTGFIHDEAFAEVLNALRRVEPRLIEVIEAQREAEEQRASKHLLKTVQKAFREALIMLPSEEYDWFDIRTSRRGKKSGAVSTNTTPEADESDMEGEDAVRANPPRPRQKEFFEFEGPMFSAVVSPGTCTVRVKTEKGFRVVARDRARREVERDLSYSWSITEGQGRLKQTDTECVTFVAPADPGLTCLEATVSQGETVCTAEAIITITDSLMPEGGEGTARESNKGLPGYTFRKAPAEMWRSTYDSERNLIIINNGHKDFVFASRNKARKLRYVCRLFVKELILSNFPGLPPNVLMERMIELGLYTEEHLR